MHLRSFLAVGLAASHGVHSLRLGLPAVALSMAFTLGRATLAVSDVAAGGLERRQGETICPSIDPSECTAVKRDERANDDDDDDDDFNATGFTEDDGEDEDD
ncbi:hypothetical protein CGRA01v4_11837 [Colletotrichum graminicola]|uniref:Uncharacterized protein n=1 Tax=Colletotrichum graminicola (strain M1.001 / M2 / FGSC 10212) TaxID=645133 RepID=E3QBZ6_COLGM|nr:uncharacterized protein GLRG_03375 [Colletotrichum graminicola M1.001]EFQ28231.1 hypothetical protein GLRG_03375 [Colletotrichum graminicola M1.001]WDK20550.1 hypothetical protein CGRA01v4_11837 [Colletotrichum graminicola]